MFFLFKAGHLIGSFHLLTNLMLIHTISFQQYEILINLTGFKERGCRLEPESFFK